MSSKTIDERLQFLLKSTETLHKRYRFSSGYEVFRVHQAVAPLKKLLCAIARDRLKGGNQYPRPEPIINGIRDFLRVRGGPCWQSEIIEIVGSQRAQQYPGLRRPYGDIWMSLRYHDRVGDEIVCVERAGAGIKRGVLQNIPRCVRVRRKYPQARGAGRSLIPDEAEFYWLPNNLFWFVEEIETFRWPEISMVTTIMLPKLS